MKLSELINKLKEIEKKGWGELTVNISSSTPNPPSNISFVGIKSVSSGDPGGWGNFVISIDPEIDLEIKKENL